MGNVIKLAQPGFDVKTAGDENLIYNSNWPLLKIYKEGSYTVGDATQSVNIATHDLGFTPMYWFFTNNDISAYQGSTSFTNARRSEFFGPGGDRIAIDSQRLLFSPSTSNLTGALTLYYYIFALDLTKQFTAPVIKVGAVGGGSSSKFVFKIAKETKDVTSNNLDDFVIHSRARSPLIHSVNPSGGAMKSFTVTHNLGYLPIFFGYSKGTNGYTLIPTGQSGTSSFQSTENTVTFASTSDQELTIVVLKDPFLVDYSVSVTI